MTDGATHFVGETTFDALSSEPVRRSLWKEPGAAIPHTSLGQNADLVVVAPATARLSSAYAAGYSHDLLTNVLIATRAPVLVCPAMHTEMWEHDAVQANVATLDSRGVHVLGPAEGRLAGGDVGAGRLVEPSEIVLGAEQVLRTGGLRSLAEARDLEGLSVLVTAGGTREPIDPVRFLGNRSSGKQGHADRRGCACPRSVGDPGHHRSPAHTAGDGGRTGGIRPADARRGHASAATAAMSWSWPRPSRTSHRCRLRATSSRSATECPPIELRPTADILATVGADKAAGQVLVGFAAETESVRENARAEASGQGSGPSGGERRRRRRRRV